MSISKFFILFTKLKLKTFILFKNSLKIIIFDSNNINIRDIWVKNTYVKYTYNKIIYYRNSFIGNIYIIAIYNIKSTYIRNICIDNTINNSINIIKYLEIYLYLS